MKTIKELRRHLAMVLSHRDYDQPAFKRAVEEYLSEHKWLGRECDRLVRPYRTRTTWTRFIAACWLDYRDWRTFKTEMGR